MQGSTIQKMHHPAQVTTYIKEQQKMALAGVRGRQPDKALLSFYASMAHLCSVAGPLLDHISLSAIITATAQLWTTAQPNSSFKPSASNAQMMHFCGSILLQLKPMLPDAKAQAVSNILWSSAKLGLNPDAFVPGMTDALAAKLLQLTKDEARHQPNAQDCANFMWALATLGHEPADKGLVDAVCNHFARLIKHRDDSKRPNAQAAANIMWALGTLGHEPGDQGLIDAVCRHFVVSIKHRDARQQPTAQGAANVWAVATLGHEPVDKGLVDDVCNHFAMLIKHHDQSKQPNAQGAANVVWAVATLGHEPADKGLVDVVCNHFAMLTKHRDESKRPNAQGTAIAVWAVATLGNEPADKGLVDAVCNHFVRLIRHHDDSKWPNQQEVANILWALATLGHYPADRGLVDAVCNHFVTLIRHLDAQQRPAAQEISNVMWALGYLRHAPPDGAASAILKRFTRLCQLPGQEPNARELSSTLLACAVLRLNFKENVSLALINRLLRLDRSSGYKQEYCNTAWSLAVSGMLSSEILHALLEPLRPLPTAEVVHEALPRQQLFQLYQALDFLQPLPTAAAQNLHEIMTRLGQRPLPDLKQGAHASVNRRLGLALGQLGLAFTPDVPLSGYWANAVLQPRDDGVTAPIVLATDSLHCFRNKKDRCVRKTLPCINLPMFHL